MTKGAKYVVKSLSGRTVKSLASVIPNEEPPDEIPLLPGDITSLSDSDLGCLHGRFVVFANYVHYCLAVAEVDDLEVEENEKYAHARATIDEADGSNQKVRDALAFVSPPAAAGREQRRERKAKVIILRARLAGLERAIKVLSREQSRREREYEREDT